MRTVAGFHGLIVAVLAVAAVGCSKTPQEPPVAKPGFSMSRDKVAIGSPVKLTYRFDVAPGATFEGDYWVFAHVLDPQGELLWTDDHQPPTPTSAWKGGQTVEYTRTVFAPNFPYMGPATVRLGLYHRESGKRLTLAAVDSGRKEYEVGKFELLPQSENIFLIYKDGWYPAEVAADNPASEWQWTKKRATISFRNPRKDVTFYLDADARPDLFTPAQQVTISAGDQVIASFAADSAEHALHTFAVTAAQLGAGEIAELILEVDRTFTPVGGDTRELGIRVFHAFVELK